MLDKEEIAMALHITINLPESVANDASTVSELRKEVIMQKVEKILMSQGFSCFGCPNFRYKLLELSDCKEEIKRNIKSIAEDKIYRLIVTCGGKRALFEFEIRLKKRKGDEHDEKRE
jgi:hypothetical protein